MTLYVRLVTKTSAEAVHVEPDPYLESPLRKRHDWERSWSVIQ